MDLYQRRNFLQGSEFGQPDHKGVMVRTEVSNPEIWCECFGKNLQELKPSDSYAIAALMSQISGCRKIQSKYKTNPLYGVAAPEWRKALEPVTPMPSTSLNFKVL